MKDKKSITITNAFQKTLKESNRKLNKYGMIKAVNFYNRSIKSWLEKNDFEMYSAHNEGKSAFAETFIRTLENKIYKGRYIFISSTNNLHLVFMKNSKSAI